MYFLYSLNTCYAMCHLSLFSLLQGKIPATLRRRNLLWPPFQKFQKLPGRWHGGRAYCLPHGGLKAETGGKNPGGRRSLPDHTPSDPTFSD